MNTKKKTKLFQSINLIDSDDALLIRDRIDQRMEQISKEQKKDLQLSKSKLGEYRLSKGEG